MAIGNASGVRTEALITAMDAPLGRAVGNALEVVECLETLKGRGPQDLEDLSVLLAARMLVLAGLAPRRGRRASARVRDGARVGRGRSRSCARSSRNQGGDPRVVDDYRAAAVGAARGTWSRRRAPGYLSALDAELVGRAAVALGAGRDRVDDAVDPAVGATSSRSPGDRCARATRSSSCTTARGRPGPRSTWSRARSRSATSAPHVLPRSWTR